MMSVQWLQVLLCPQLDLAASMRGSVSFLLIAYQICTATSTPTPNTDVPVPGRATTLFHAVTETAEGTHRRNDAPHTPWVVAKRAMHAPLGLWHHSIAEGHALHLQLFESDLVHCTVTRVVHRGIAQTWSGPCSEPSNTKQAGQFAIACNNKHCAADVRL